MNATELYHQNGTPAGAWYCGTCRYIRRTQDEADGCCKPKICGCGAEVPRGWILCVDCDRAKRLARERAAFAKADKHFIGEYAGALVFVDDWNEYLDLDVLDDRITESIHDFIGLGGRPWEWEPPRVYAATPQQPMIDVDGALESALDDAFDGARETIGSVAERALTELVDAWSLEHMPLVYHSNENIALVPWPQ